MNKRQARRIALATEASYILFGAETHAITDRLSDADMRRFCEAQEQMAWEMLRKAGFSRPMLAEDILIEVLGNVQC